MKRRFPIALLLTLFAACTDPALYDASGTWSMTLHFGAGTCGAPGETETQDMVVLQNGDEYIALTDDPNDVTTGTVLTTESSATLSATVINHDVLNDGGTTTGTVTFTAKANETMALSGTGSLRASGGVVCMQAFTITGVLR